MKQRKKSFEEELSEIITDYMSDFAWEDRYIREFVEEISLAHYQTLQEIVDEIEEEKKFNYKKPLCGWKHYEDEVDICEDCELVNNALDKAIAIIKKRIEDK